MKAKPILIKPGDKLFTRIVEAAKGEKRKPGPMVIFLLERYFESLDGAKS